MVQDRNFDEFCSLLKTFASQEGANYASTGKWGAYKTSAPHQRVPVIDIPAFWVVAQGQKYAYAGGKRVEYHAGKALIVFYPMAIQTEIIQASQEEPFLIAGVAIDLPRILDVLQRIERVEGPGKKVSSVDSSGIVEITLTDDLLDPLIRLYRLTENSTDTALLSDGILDEIYYRLLSGDEGIALRHLLGQRGEIQRISKAIDYIHQHLDEPVSIEKLANLVHMAQPTFYENFKNVMHISPLQYAKSVKLDKAQQLIRQGKKANEAGYLVGYNSPAQFSREYKRYFGYTPSATS